MKEFRIIVLLTKNDIKDFYLGSLTKYRPYYTTRIFWVLCFSIVAPVVYFSRLSVQHQDTIMNALYGVIAIFPVFIAMVVYRCLKLANEVYASNIKLRHEVTYTFNADGIASSGYNFDSVYKWPEIHKMMSTKKFLLIYSSAANAMIIPASYLTDAQTGQIKQWQMSK